VFRISPEVLLVWLISLNEHISEARLTATRKGGFPDAVEAVRPEELLQAVADVLNPALRANPCCTALPKKLGRRCMPAQGLPKQVGRVTGLGGVASLEHRCGERAPATSPTTV
jgi:hypothetical protein